MAERIVIFYGSRRDYQKLLDERIDPSEETIEFLAAIRKYNSLIRASDLPVKEVELFSDKGVDNCIVRADDFGSVLSHVVSNFASIIEQSYKVGTLYVHNPPRQSLQSLESFHPGDIEVLYSEYPALTKDVIGTIYSSLSERILGQEEGKRSLISNLYRLMRMNSDKPAVLLFYGPSGVGKTEMAKCLSSELGGHLTRIQFSMMQTSEAFDYVFGAEHSKNSLARDFLARESNVILIDEFDKVSPTFYNAFYELFDEGLYSDTNYDVDLHNAIFVCTANFSSEKEIKKALGPAMYSRFGACVEFRELSDEDKRAILQLHYSKVLSYLDEVESAVIDESSIRTWFVRNISRYNNVRIMKTKLEQAIFNKLSINLINQEEEVPSR